MAGVTIREVHNSCGRVPGRRAVVPGTLAGKTRPSGRRTSALPQMAVPVRNRCALHLEPEHAHLFDVATGMRH